jgi:hypothetical protein
VKSWMCCKLQVLAVATNINQGAANHGMLYKC